MSTIRTNTITDAAGTGAPDFPNGLTAPSITVGSLPTFQCRAWVNFNGTGTPAIRASGNVTSITKNGTGDYTVNFTTPMPDANYAVPQGASDGDSVGITGNFGFKVQTMTTTSVRGWTGWNANSDASFVFVSIFR